MPTALNRLVMVGRLSSAARMPLPGFVISAIVAWRSSSGFMNAFLELGYRSSNPALPNQRFPDLNLVEMVCPDPIEFRRIQLVLLAGRAVFHRDGQLRACLLDFAEAEVGGRKPETEFVVIRIAIDFLCEQIFCRLEIAIAHGCQAKVEEMEGWIWLQLLQLAGQSLRLRDATFVVENQCQIRHDLSIPGFEFENVFEYLLRLPQIAVISVNNALRIVGEEEFGVMRDGLARPPISVIQLPLSERFGRPVVHVHRNDGFLSDYPHTPATDTFLRKKINCQRGTLVV